ncbi:MAG: formate dehydrogenase subunit gamma [Sinobacteraceae bacterium]|nr:formate dehydrogenase subunit gamma [Nevskia sp.]MDI3259851.1 formate dehydrogenase subunit gamma [Nevskiaceae bacterium]
METARKIIPIRPEPGANLPAEQRAAVLAALQAHRERQGALLPVLHAVQDALGYVPREAVPLIAHELNLSRAEVHGVISFYHHFRSEKSGRHVIYLCRAEACQANGCARLEAHAKKRLGIDYRQTTADGAWTLEPVYCLGNCACGPSLMIDTTLYARVTPERFDAVLREHASGEAAA